MVIIAFGSEWYNNFTMHGRIQPLPWCYEFSSAVTSELNHRLVMNRGRVLILAFIRGLHVIGFQHGDYGFG
ncbi:hypothetical protein HanXRQr2_Chr12g0531891 [Helianthus annuus]|uniref:Uncharacterized protein n=1 Tax=Helianthus annuus TaxID=4232 RepID=A0A251SZX3_HELAN|nr:hypothetical protein HanXRQr2_Chr12g0531891 [Helianthus annuus]